MEHSDFKIELPEGELSIIERRIIVAKYYGKVPAKVIANLVHVTVETIQRDVRFLKDNGIIIGDEDIAGLRRSQIAKCLGEVSVRELSERYGVSKVTIYNDLRVIKKLKEEGKEPVQGEKGRIFNETQVAINRIIWFYTNGHRKDAIAELEELRQKKGIEESKELAYEKIKALMESGKLYSDPEIAMRAKEKLEDAEREKEKDNSDAR